MAFREVGDEVIGFPEETIGRTMCAIFCCCSPETLPDVVNERMDA